MFLNDDSLHYFDDRVLALKPSKATEYLRQVDYLIEQLQKKIDDHSVFKVISFEKTGSLTKGTVLHPKGDYGVDADIAVYLDVTEAERADVALLHNIILDLLIKVYPTKYKDDFKVQPKTLGIHFHVSGLDVDLVPVIPIANEPGYSWQPSSDGGTPVKTCISGQLEFIERRAGSDPLYRTLIRFLKKWRNHKELDKFRSFTIELITAHLQDIKGKCTSIEDGLQRFFLYIAQTGLKDIVSFPENNGLIPSHTEPVVIIDPVNPYNNVAARLSDAERLEIVSAAQEAWETLNTASWNNQKGETMELWKQIFSRSFVIED